MQIKLTSDTKANSKKSTSNVIIGISIIGEKSCVHIFGGGIIGCIDNDNFISFNNFFSITRRDGHGYQKVGESNK